MSRTPFSLISLHTDYTADNMASHMLLTSHGEGTYIGKGIGIGRMGIHSINTHRMNAHPTLFTSRLTYILLSPCGFAP